jgi:hypothetical protein
MPTSYGQNRSRSPAPRHQLNRRLHEDRHDDRDFDDNDDSNNTLTEFTNLLMRSDAKRQRKRKKGDQ